MIFIPHISSHACLETTVDSEPAFYYQTDDSQMRALSMTNGSNKMATLVKMEDRIKIVFTKHRFFS